MCACSRVGRRVGENASIPRCRVIEARLSNDRLDLEVVLDPVRAPLPAIARLAITTKRCLEIERRDSSPRCMPGTNAARHAARASDRRDRIARKPVGRELAIRIASSSSRYGMITITGPKTSSRAMRISGVTFGEYRAACRSNRFQARGLPSPPQASCAPSAVAPQSDPAPFHTARALTSGPMKVASSSRIADNDCSRRRSRDLQASS